MKLRNQTYDKIIEQLENKIRDEKQTIEYYTDMNDKDFQYFKEVEPHQINCYEDAIKKYAELEQLRRFYYLEAEKNYDPYSN